MRHAQGKPRQFAGRIELLEDRRVMSAEPLDAVGNCAFEAEAPPLVAPVVGAAPEQPDFWIDQRAIDAFTSYLQQIEQSLAQAHAQSGWFAAQNAYGYTGRGQTVAVIDSGIAYDHFALGGGFGGDYRVVGGWDFAENDADPYDDGGAGGHGTHVAGIIGNDSETNSGVASGVDLVSLRVFNDAGQGFFSWVEKALNWVYNNRHNYANPITTVNLSLGVSSWNAASIPQWASLEDEFAKLESVGIFIAVSAGNSYASYKTPGLSYPAASQYVVPVMSTDDGGYLSSFSQRLDRAIAAPGRGITSTVPDYKGDADGRADDFAAMSGTSMAAPYVAGAAVLIRQAMQAAGMTSITQDAIYDHMLATADTIYDGLSRLSYKRLNLSKALEALTPADDYGSSIGTAEDLGTLAGSTTVDGAINTASDADFFRFTAGATGTATFSVANASGGMTPSWQAFDSQGNAIAAGSGSALSFAVVAGDSYTIKLASTTGRGEYQFTATLQQAFSYEDWGVVAWNELAGLAVNGQQWYGLTAGQGGVLTVHGAVRSGAGDVQIELYTAQRQLIGASTAVGGVMRVDAHAAAGEQFYVRVIADGASVDFTLANVVSQSGQTITVEGTAGDDGFEFIGGSAASDVIINGLRYSFTTSRASQFVFHGGAGHDSIVLRGSAGDDVATLRVGSATLVGAGYSVSADGVDALEAHGGGGFDRSILHDSAGHDEFRAWSDRAQLRGANFAHDAFGFDVYEGVSSGGYDRAYLYDSSGDDRYEAHPQRATMTAATFTSAASGFDLTWAFASGGFDAATLYDSAGNDEYHSWADRAQLLGPGYASYANGFDQYDAVATSGDDSAYLEDSTGDDLYESWSNRARMSWAGYASQASGFDSMYGISSSGDDRAVLNDSAGHDVYRAYADRVQMKSSASTSYALNFRQSTAVAASGGYDRAILYDSAHDDVLQVRAWGVALTAGRIRNEASGFEYAAAISTLGTDVIDAEAVDFAFARVGAWK